MRWFLVLGFVLLNCYDYNDQYCGVINHGMRGPVVMKAKSEECDIVLVDSCGTVIGIPGKYPVARALCKSMNVGDTVTVRLGKKARCREE